MEYLFINSYTNTYKKNSIGSSKIGNNCLIIWELLLANRSQLRILDLINCEIEDEGADIILEGLKLNNTLKLLRLSN